GRSLDRLSSASDDPSMTTVVDTDDGPLAILTVHAPGPRAQANGWHTVEQGGQARFRWTASGSLEWAAIGPLPDCKRVRIVVPVLMEVAPKFGGACRISFAGQNLPVARQGRDLLADFETTGGAGLQRVTLTTPPPISPFEVNGSIDKRKFGLAIRVSDRS